MIYNQYVLRFPAAKGASRDAVEAALNEQKIGNAIYYPVPLHLQQCFADLGYKQGDMPHAEQAAKEVLAIPVYPELSQAQKDEVAGAVLKAVGAEGQAASARWVPTVALSAWEALRCTGSLSPPWERDNCPVSGGMRMANLGRPAFRRGRQGPRGGPRPPRAAGRGGGRPRHRILPRRRRRLRLRQRRLGRRRPAHRGELVGRFLKDRRPLRAEALSTNSSAITALATISVSRRSLPACSRPTPARATSPSASRPPATRPTSSPRSEKARQLGLKTIAFTGQGGGQCAAVADILLDAPSKETPRIQECHVVLYHILCELVENAFTDK